MDRERVVLVVDDEEPVRRMPRIWLEAAFDLTTAQAADGVAGLRLAQRLHPLLVVTDVGMPAMDGLALLRRLKQDPATSDVPVVLISGEDHRAAALAGGAAAFVQKPFRVAALEEAVGPALERCPHAPGAGFPSAAAGHTGAPETTTSKRSRTASSPRR